MAGKKKDANKDSSSKPESAKPLAETKPKALPKLDFSAALEKAHDDASLAGFDLSGIDFSHCDLRAVSFEGSNLTGCKFTGTILQGCNFKGAKFDPDDFNDADTRWAVWQ